MMTTTVYTEEQLCAMIPDIKKVCDEYVEKRVSKILHDERYKLILSRQKKRARLRELATGFASLLGCIVLPVMIAEIFGVPELYTVELITLPLGIYFLWEVL